VSFILDALRKSEHERQRQGGPGIADLKPIGARAHFPLWAVALGALLLLNIVVVLILVLRGESQPAPAAPVAADAQPADQHLAAVPAASAAVAPPVASVVPLPHGISPAPEDVGAGRNEQFDAASQPVRPPDVRPLVAHQDPELDAALSAAAADRDAGDENLPTLDDITLQGTGRIPELHLDIHVYATRPAERFVFINMHKYREGSSTPEGTRIERITRDGVVLNHRGLRFMMPRQ